MSGEAENIFKFLDEQTTPDPYYEYTDSLAASRTPVIIDNGSYKCRAGWATDESPRLTFKNVTARLRPKKEKDMDIQVGNDISNIEVVRGQIRSPFERNLVTHYEAQEQVLDYVFSHLGINSNGRVDHPIVMTEATANPNYCRQMMSELLFECYGVPEVVYGIDSLFSLYTNLSNPESANALVIGCGYNTIHVLPLLNGELQTEQCRRMNIGGGHLDYFMQRLLQLKSPAHMAAVSLSRAEELVQGRCHLAVDYQSSLSQWASDDCYAKNVHKIQLPYTQTTSNILTATQQKLKRDQQVRRLKEVNARRREKKLAEEQDRLRRLLQIQELGEDEDNDDLFMRTLRKLDIESEEELQDIINEANASIQRIRQRILNDEVERREAELMSTPDEQLSKEQREQKRRIKSAKESQAKKSRLEEKKAASGHHPPVGDPVSMENWLQKMRQDRQKILDSRNDRRQRRSDMTRRRTEASHHRMKILTSLAQGPKKNKVDTFGKNDDDWDVYKEINKDAGESDSEAEQEKLDDIENLLRQHDPQFKDGSEGEAFDIAEYYRLHVAVERIRVPELLFQPSMIGIEQAGIAETVDFVLKKFSAENQKLLTKCVFLTGGSAHFQNFKPRLETELRQMLPFKSDYSVFVASNPSLDAWLGARKMTSSPSFQTNCITREDYDEKGGEYLKEHCCSNRFFASVVTETNKAGADKDVTMATAKVEEIKSLEEH